MWTKKDSLIYIRVLDYIISISKSLDLQVKEMKYANEAIVLGL